MKRDDIKSASIVSDYNKGVSITALSIKYNMTIEGVRYHLKRYGNYQVKKARVKDIFEERIKNIDTADKTKRELYEYFKDIYPRFKSFSQVLSNSKIPYKKLRS